MLVEPGLVNNLKKSMTAGQENQINLVPSICSTSENEDKCVLLDVTGVQMSSHH